ncbi:LysR family transcriptional regulator [Rhodococcus tukisamuensis]|uniref:LysR family transcriptional regulator, hydrogen peroxide-inducible genes activator n=1 Tax=Rhodococcus tukisamuensis TaxID=168276 RepID=A0A1G7EQT1_9NOCA|nr:LysR family transcriptional regulator [Rhodococcus tukisamuensis]SDE66048.1 LysR family transcriptional regulator, hydrogen peroxide-inducible genes activator [Rhodococcus tukisamuensis]
MRFEQLRYLEAALRTGSFRQAAKEVGVTQPTITTQVQRLEEDLGVVLVLRGANGVRATYAAERILPHALAVMRAENALRQEASAIDNLKIGSIRLAAVSTASLTLLPDVVKLLHREHPNIRFEVTEGGSEMVRRGVSTGHFDMGLLSTLKGDDCNADTLQYIDLLTGRLVLAIPEEHPLARKESVQASDLAGQPLIFFSKGSILRDALERLVEGIEIRPVYFTDSAETSIRMVKAGVGIAIANTVAPSTVSGDGVVLSPVSADWAATRLAAVVRRGEMRSPVVQTLLRLIRQQVAEINGA